MHRVPLSSSDEHPPGVLIVQLGALGARGEIVEDEVEEREESVVSDFEDVVLELGSPVEVGGGGDVVSVGGERREEIVVSNGGSGGDVSDRDGSEGRLLGGGRREDRGDGGDSSDVVDGNHVDGVVDVGDETELDGSLDESPDEVVGVGD